MRLSEWYRVEAKIEQNRRGAKDRAADNVACVSGSGGAKGQQDQPSNRQQRAHAVGDTVGDLFADALVRVRHLFFNANARPRSASAWRAILTKKLHRGGKAGTDAWELRPLAVRLPRTS